MALWKYQCQNWGTRNPKHMEQKWGEVNFSAISACKWVACTHWPQPSGSTGNYYDDRRKMGFGTFHWIDLENCWVSMSCQLSEPKCAWFQGFTIVNHLKNTWQDWGQGWDGVDVEWILFQVGLDKCVQMLNHFVPIDVEMNLFDRNIPMCQSRVVRRVQTLGRGR